MHIIYAQSDVAFVVSYVHMDIALSLEDHERSQISCTILKWKWHLMAFQSPIPNPQLSLSMMAVKV